MFLDHFIGIFSHPMSNLFPKTFSSAVCAAKVNSTVTKEIYVVCPNDTCNALYKKEDSNKFCTQLSHNKLCGSTLGYDANLSHGQKVWRPYKIFQFIPPSSTLKNMFQSMKFLDILCTCEPNLCTFEDFWDGNIWKKFSADNFFSSKFNIGLMLNVDWFHPFKHSEYKVAALILTVLNLPREERFKKKWTIIAGKATIS